MFQFKPFLILSVIDFYHTFCTFIAEHSKRNGEFKKYNLDYPIQHPEKEAFQVRSVCDLQTPVFFIVNLVRPAELRNILPENMCLKREL